MVELENEALRDYERAHGDCVLFDLSNHGLLSCTGKDAGRFLHNLCTNEVLKLPAGSASEAFLTTAQAKIVDQVWILNRGGSEPTYLVDVGPGEGPRIFQHLDRFLISEQLEIQDLTSQFAHYHLVGPNSGKALQAKCATDVSKLQDLEAVDVAHAGRQLLIWRRNRLGITGYDLICRVEDSASWLQALNLPVPLLDSAPVFECLRIEAGLPKFGSDITENNLPQEVGRTEQTISFTKGCYIGQETVARVRSFGHVNRTLRGITLPEGARARAGDKLFHEGTEVGVVTSCAVSPRLKRGIALAYVRRGHEAAGTPLSLAPEPGALIALVSDLPFAQVAN
jgi:tRNA-modifying protein YgfZ